MPDGSAALDDYPRASARTQRFTLGVPRDFAVSPDGRRVTFLRSRGPEDAVNCLWTVDVADGGAVGEEVLLADPAEIARSRAAATPQAELARRERARETAAGIVAYSTDRSGRVIAFALGGELYVVEAPDPAAGDPAAGRPAVRRIDTGSGDAGIFDPRISPDARLVSFVVGTGLWLAPADGSAPGAPLLVPDTAAGEPAGAPPAGAVSWGSAEFVANEEMSRSRGHWWSPDGSALAVARVDESAVVEWHLADPANPAGAARAVRYPAAGTANAEVTLHVVDVADSKAGSADGSAAGSAGAVRPTPVRWDTAALPYLVDVSWEPEFPLTLVVQSRDQRRLEVLSADPAGGTTVVATQTDPHWVAIVAGAPRRCPLGVLTVGEHDGTRAVALDGVRISPTTEWVRRIVDVGWGEGTGGGVHVLCLASRSPGEVTLSTIALDADGTARPGAGFGAADGGSDAAPAGVVSAVARAGTVVVSQAGLDHATEHFVRVAASPTASPAGPCGPAAGSTPITSLGADPFGGAGPLNLTLDVAGPLEVPVAVVWPAHHRHDDRASTPAPLPILLDPYGGPGAQRVVAARSAYAASQWLANQGFCVVVADGRGTPGRIDDPRRAGAANWERAVHGDLAGAALDDQIAALDHVVARHGDRVDPGRVAIRGWSFGGYLAALAVLRRPDRFHAAVAGAPVTDWSLYDTHYTERYLGRPDDDADGAAAYRRSSLLHDRPTVKRPIMLIHGLADDNVVAAHTLRLSSALLAAGHPHEVLPLSGVTHMTPQEEVAENLLRLQVAFLRRSLAAADN